MKKVSTSALTRRVGIVQREGEGEGEREREKRTKKRYESGDFLREYNTGVGQRRVIIIGGNNAINLDNERSRQSFRQVSERSPT